MCGAICPLSSVNGVCVVKSVRQICKFDHFGLVFCFVLCFVRVYVSRMEKRFYSVFFTRTHESIL